MQNNANVSSLLSDRIDIKVRQVFINKERHFKMIMG